MLRKLSSSVRTHTLKYLSRAYAAKNPYDQVHGHTGTSQIHSVDDEGLLTVMASPRQLFDLELLCNGGFAPLEGFLNKANYDSVVKEHRLSNGHLWPIPIVFDVDEIIKDEIEKSEYNKIIIVDNKLKKLAQLDVEEIFEPDKSKEAHLVYGGDRDHPEVININKQIKNYQVGGKITPIQSHEFEDYSEQRRSPHEVKNIFKEKGWDKIVAFQTRNPLHYAHIELTKVAAEMTGCKLFLNPVVGPTKPGDIDQRTRMKCQLSVLDEYKKEDVLLSVLPLAMRMGGPREAMLHALIRKNQGCTHFILGRDHAGPGSNSLGKDIQGPYEARDFCSKFADEIGIQTVEFDMMVYVDEHKKYFGASKVPEGCKALKLSGTEVRKRLLTGEDIPSWFSPPQVVKLLREASFEKEIFNINVECSKQSPQEIVKEALQMQENDVAIAFSGAEDVVLIDQAVKTGLPFRVFCLETGRLHSETYEFFDAIEKHQGIKIEYTFPDHDETVNLVNEKGMFSFYEDGHQECCKIRKVNPLRKKLSTLKAWITGVRKDQSATRVHMDHVQIDRGFKGKDNAKLVKFNPLADITSKQVWKQIIKDEIPYNALHNSGFVSIGCQPCTRAINPGMHEREGRWWWEDKSLKECGLHVPTKK